MKSQYLGLIISILMWGCSGSSEKNTAPEASAIEVNNFDIPAEGNQTVTNNNAELLGTYHGVQEAYYLKNQYGNDMEVNGNKIPVPSIDYKFILKEGGIVTLQQINLDDDSRVYYHGSFTVDNSNLSIKIVCNLSDDHSSNPTYNIEFDKSTNIIKCIGNNEPEFLLEKNTSSSKKSEDEPIVEKEIYVDGTYTYKDESVNISISIRGDSWFGQTTIISGMGDDYDKPEYQSGIVKGQELFESSGMVKIGYVNGSKLVTSIGDNTVTLNK
jgi:hypothetical protein